jgi:outer membrane lipoprotein-sorting protein
LAALLCAVLLFSGWGDTWNSIRENAGKIESVRADFVQEKHLPILARPLRSQGRFVFRMPDALRWEYTKPVRSVLLLHDGEARRFLPDGEGGWVRDETARLESMGVVLGEITNWLNGRFDDNPDFAAELAPDRRIVLTPKSESLARIISRIVLSLSETPGLMESVTIHEGPDSFTRIVFPEPELNPEIDERVFRAPEAPESE